jgi:hypothetical protein
MPKTHPQTKILFINLHFPSNSPLSLSTIILSLDDFLSFAFKCLDDLATNSLFQQKKMSHGVSLRENEMK